MKNEQIDRLLQSAAQANQEVPAMPFGFDTRVVARPLTHPPTARNERRRGCAVPAAYLVDSTSTVTEYGAKL